jgi:hypothetical protein
MRHPFPSLISARFARRFIGGLLLLLGVLGIASALTELVWAAQEMRFWSDLERWLVLIALSIVPIVIAFALFLRRMRGFATLLCLFGPLQVMVMLRGSGFDTIAVFVLAYWFAFILLHWPERREAAAATTERLDRPAKTDWRGRVLVSLSDASVERAPDRFREIMLSSMALGGLTVASYLIFELLPSKHVGDMPPVNDLPPLNDLPPYSSLPSSSLTSLLDGWWTVRILWAAFWFVILLPVILRLNRLVRQARARSAEEEILRPGSRQPILYLRSFDLDEYIGKHRLTLRALLFAQSQATAEEILAKDLRRCGPVIAIGRPGEQLPELGAARFYVSGERWRDKIAEVVDVVRLVVVATGVTQGLAWELAYLIKNLPADRLVLWAHPHVKRMNSADREAEWTAFLAALGKLFPKPLPQRLLETRFIHFDADFNPIAVEPRRWRWWGRQRRASRAMLAAKGLPSPDPVLRARRRQTLQLAAAAAVALLTTGGIIAHAHRIDRRLRTQLQALESLAVALASYENEKTPSEMLQQHEVLLSWSKREWREHLGVPEELYDRLHMLAARYVLVFELAHPEKIIEDLLYAEAAGLWADMADVEDAPARLAALTPVSAAIEAFQSEYQEIRGNSHMEFSQDLRSEHRLALPALEDRTHARANLLRAEQEVLQFLVDHPGSWTIVAAKDGVGVPEFSDRDLQDWAFRHTERCIEAFSQLSRELTLSPRLNETSGPSDAPPDDEQASEAPPP